MSEKLLKIAVLVGGNGGSKLCTHLHLPASSSTLLRQIHRQPIAEIEISDAVGIDETCYQIEM